MQPDRSFTCAYGALEPVSPLIRRIVARNPGPFTFRGTGTYVVGRGKVAGLMGEVGKGITSFKRGLNEGKQDIENAAAENARDITPEKEKV